jgi:hypothetical protein
VIAVITEHQLDIQSASIIELYQRLEDDLFKMFIDRLTAKGAYALKSDTILQWQLERLNDLHLVNQDTIKLIAQTTNIAQPLLQKLIIDNGLDVAKQVTKQLKVPEPQYNLTNQLLHGILNQTMTDLNNNVNETLITTNYGEGEATKMYRQIITDTTAQVITGLKTPEKALADTIYKWTDSGIKTSLTTKGGANWGLEGYTRTVITSTTFRTYNEVTTTTANENDCYTFVMTEHPAARPACANIQGRIVTNLTVAQAQSKGISYPSIYDHGYGEPAGTLGINCRHRLIPYIKGVNTNTLPTPPDPITAVNRHKVMQQQRALERRIRLYKRKAMEADKLSDKEGLEHFNGLIRDNQQRLRNIVKDHDYLYRDYAREKSY